MPHGLNRHQCTLSQACDTEPPQCVSCCLRIGHRGIQKFEFIFDPGEPDNRAFENDSEEAYQSATAVTALVGRNLNMKFSILSVTMEGLLLLLSRC